MRTSLALSIVAVVVLATASGCAGSTHEQTTAADDTTNKPSANDAKPATGSATAVGGVTLVHGQFAELSVALDNASALAIADDQTTYAAPLDAAGNFTLRLPVGASYRIAFVNQLAGGGQVKVGALSFKTGDQISSWFGANAAGEVDLGILLGNGNGGASTADHTNDPATITDASRSASGAKNADGSSVGLAAVNACLIWPSVTVYAGVDVDAKWADLAASAHASGNLDDDKNCAYFPAADGSTIWGAPWSVAANGLVIVAGGAEVGGGISGGAGAEVGFGSGFYGGYFTGASEGLSIGFGVGIGGGVSANLGGIGAGIGAGLSNVGTAISGAIQTGAADVGGAIQTGAADVNGAIQTGAADVGGAIQTGAADVNGAINAVGGALASVHVGTGVQVGVSAGVVAGVDFSNGWAVGVGAGIEGDVCLTAATCGTALSCVAGSCATR